MVSIVVPVYNVREYLPACIESILGQTYRDIQLILVDDGSPDDCGAICDAYAQKDSRVLSLHKPNGGVSSARNYGLNYVRGEYVTFCDSDDAYKADWLEKMVNSIRNNDADIALGCFASAFKSGEEDLSCVHETGIYQLEDDRKKVAYCFDKLLTPKHGWEVTTRLFRSEIVFREHIRFCENCGNFGEDLGFVLSYTLFARRIVSISEFGYLYNIRENSMMQSSMTVPKLDSLHVVYSYHESYVKTAVSNPLATHFLDQLYFQMIAAQIIPKVWIPGNVPEQIREAAIARVQNWPEMERRLRSHLEQKNAWNPCYSGSYNAEVICHVQFLLNGSWKKLRLQCKLIRIFKPILDFYGKQIRKRLMWK